MTLLSLIFSTCISGFTLVTTGNVDYCVSNDYYQIDGVRTPMGLTDVEKLLDKTGMSLPSVSLVDEIYKQATTKLKPKSMHYLTDYKAHDLWIDYQLKDLGNPKGLIAGHKKDIIRVPKGSPRVLIYGWHRLNGVPTQPLSNVHHREYFDYSHGVRLVYEEKTKPNGKRP